jgi:hypothetical protein
MHCLRCHGLMVTIRLEDVGSSSLFSSAWQCLMCGEVIDSVIAANRKASRVDGEPGAYSIGRGAAVRKVCP